MSARGLIARLLHLDEDGRRRVVRGLSHPQARTLEDDWEFWARRGQIAPPGDWRVWLIRAGRGFGKTRAGAEWVSGVARETPDARIALVGATAEDAHVCSGIGVADGCRVAAGGGGESR